MCTLREPEKKFADGGEGFLAPPPGVANEEGFSQNPKPKPGIDTPPTPTNGYANAAFSVVVA